MKKINIDEEMKFDLEMEIQGDVASGSSGKLFFTVIAENMRLSFEGKPVENGVYRVTIPSLKNILPCGTYDYEVNVVIDGKHFVPISESIELVQDIKPVVKMKDSNNDSEVSIKIKESALPKILTPETRKPILQRVGLVEI